MCHYDSYSPDLIAITDFESFLVLRKILKQCHKISVRVFETIYFKEIAMSSTETLVDSLAI